MKLKQLLKESNPEARIARGSQASNYPLAHAFGYRLQYQRGIAGKIKKHKSGQK